MTIKLSMGYRSVLMNKYLNSSSFHRGFFERILATIKLAVLPQCFIEHQ